MSDIAELFDRDPLKLTDQDLDTIITSLRQQRANFNLGAKAAGSMKPAKPKTAKTVAAQIDLASLGLLGGPK